MKLNRKSKDRTDDKGSLTHFHRIESSSRFRKPEVLAQYKKLAKQPLWRLFKVIYAFISAVLVLRAIFAVADSVCLESTPCNAPSATGNGIVGGIGALLGLLILFWLIRRLTIYIVYGNTKRKADDEAAAR